MHIEKWYEKINKKSMSAKTVYAVPGGGSESYGNVRKSAAIRWFFYSFPYGVIKVGVKNANSYMSATFFFLSFIKDPVWPKACNFREKRKIKK